MPLMIDMIAVGNALANDDGRCLDLMTGAVLPAARCNPSDIGEGQPGVKAGRRFIRIPCFDDHIVDFARQSAEDDIQDAGPLPDEHAKHELLEANEDVAQTVVAYRWLSSLKFGFVVEAVFDGLSGMRWDPVRRQWLRLPWTRSALLSHADSAHPAFHLPASLRGPRGFICSMIRA